MDKWHDFERSPIVRTVVAIGLAIWTGGSTFAFLNGLWIPGGAVTAGIIGGAVGGFTLGFVASGGDVQAGLSGALSGAVFGGIGAYGDLAGWDAGGLGARTLAHAVGGGIVGRLQGQKFISSFIAAGAGEFASIGPPQGRGLTYASNVALGAVRSAVVGGTAAAIGGGKFANGAKTAAYGYLFNEAGTALANKSAEVLTNIDRSKAALNQLFGQSVSNVDVVENSLRAKFMGVYATTGVNVIYVNDSLSGFFENDFTVLEEYYHVLRQWNTGKMTTGSYLSELARNGYNGNKYEIEAKAFAKDNLSKYLDLKSGY